LRKALGTLALGGLALYVAFVLVRRPQPPPPPAPTAPAPSLATPAQEPRAALRAQLVAALEGPLTDHKLSSDEIDAATDALLRLREARRELAALPRTPENAERLRELRDAVGTAMGDFEYLLDLDPAELSELISARGEGDG
jgi:hypothetical protein